MTKAIKIGFYLSSILLALFMPFQSGAQIELFGVKSNMTQQQVVAVAKRRGLNCDRQRSEAVTEVLLTLLTPSDLRTGEVPPIRNFDCRDTRDNLHIEILENQVTFLCHIFQGCSEDFSVKDVANFLEENGIGKDYRPKSDGEYCFRKTSRPKEYLCVLRNKSSSGRVFQKNQIRMRLYPDSSSMSFGQ